MAVTDDEYIMLNKIQHILCPLEAYGLVGERKNGVVLKCGVPVLCKLVCVWGGGWGRGAGVVGCGRVPDSWGSGEAS